LLGQKNIKFCRHSLYELDQLAIQADVVIVKGVLHHIFDLPRFVKALKFVTKNGTNLLLAHSSYNSVPGFSHYFYNHLAWVLGGTDLEKRINVGVKIFRGRHWQLTHDLVRHRVNDLTGVFYMARSSGDIIRIFRREGFIIEKIPGQKYQDYYLSLRQHHQQMLIIERKQVLRKSRRLMAIGLIESFQYLAMRSTLMDRWLGFLYKFFFSKPAHLFIAQLGK